LRGVLDAIIEQKDIDAVSIRVGQLLDESLVVDKSGALRDPEDHDAVYRITQSGRTWDLSTVDFEKIKEDFQHATFKNIEIADLRAFIEHKLDQMLTENATRTDFAQRLQEIIDAYNAGSSNSDNYFEELIKFTKDLKEESERHIREGLSEDELELFDLLKKERMTKEETQKVRLAAKSLLHRLLQESPKVLVQDWHKDSQTKRQVKSAVEEVLNAQLPESYDRVLFKQKCDNVFDLMVNYASQGLKWAA
jgi:type I restriction enzyme R subunit